MISVQEAQKKLLEAVSPIIVSVRMDVRASLGFVLAENCYSELNLPPFNQSNVDGYALCFSAEQQMNWEIVAEVKAGDNPDFTLKMGEAARIFTGAKVPLGADAIVMQEFTEKKGNQLFIKNESHPRPGEQIRLEGSQLKKGELSLEKGTVLNAAGLGFLNMLGLNEVQVYRKPRVTLVITGNELQMPGELLEKGKVYESNAAALEAALQALALKFDKVIFAKDNKAELKQCVEEGLKQSDVLLISGGISVGDYDFVNEVLSELETDNLFHGVAQKPGKPLYAGKNKQTLVFGLPGNPASALTCFYAYVYPGLNKMMGKKNLFLPKIKAELGIEINKKAGLAHFLRASYNKDKVFVLEAQDSFMMKSFANANCLLFLDAESTQVKAGELVEVYLLPE